MCVGMDRVSFSSNKFYHRDLQVTDVRRLLYKKFYKVHDLSLVNVNSSSHLKIYYRKPDDPKTYEKEIENLTRVINKTESSEFFIRVVNSYQKYPSFVILDGDVIDIPVYIDLHMDTQDKP